MHRTRNRLTALRAGSDAGFTLSELLVTMLLLGIVSSLCVTTVVRTSDAIAKDGVRTDSLNIASVGMNTLTKNIRAATELETSTGVNSPAFVQAGPNSMTFNANLGTQPTRLVYAINSNRELIETRYVSNNPPTTAPYYTFPGYPGTGVSRILARKIPTGTSLFTFRDDPGAVINVGAGVTDDTTLKSIFSVEISMTVQSQPGSGTKPVNLTNRVFLPNIGVAKR